MAAAENDAGSEKTRGSRFGTLKVGAEPAGHKSYRAVIVLYDGRPEGKRLFRMRFTQEA
jgi:hypothetical protein